MTTSHPYTVADEQTLVDFGQRCYTALGGDDQTNLGTEPLLDHDQPTLMPVAEVAGILRSPFRPHGPDFRSVMYQSLRGIHAQAERVLLAVHHDYRAYDAALREASKTLDSGTATPRRTRVCLVVIAQATVGKWWIWLQEKQKAKNLRQLLTQDCQGFLAAFENDPPSPITAAFLAIPDVMHLANTHRERISAANASRASGRSALAWQFIRSLYDAQPQTKATALADMMAQAIQDENTRRHPDQRLPELKARTIENQIVKWRRSDPS